MSKFSWYWEISIGISQEYVLENSPAIHKETQKEVEEQGYEEIFQ